LQNQQNTSYLNTMQTTDPKEELRKVRIVCAINLVVCAFMLFSFINVIGTGVTWRIVCSGIGCGIFVILVFAIFTRLLKLQKQLNS